MKFTVLTGCQYVKIRCSVNLIGLQNFCSGYKHNIGLRPGVELCTWVLLCQTITQAGDQLDLLVKGTNQPLFRLAKNPICKYPPLYVVTGITVFELTYKAAQTLVIQSRARTIFTSSFGYHVYG